MTDELPVNGLQETGIDDGRVDTVIFESLSGVGDVETYIPNKDEAILLYCGGGYRSILAADALQRMGYSNVVSMDGGIKGWRYAGYPIER